MNALEQANARRIVDHYVIANPDGDPSQAIRDEAWLERQDISWLQVFQAAVRCLDIVLCRVLDKRSAAGR